MSEPLYILEWIDVGGSRSGGMFHYTLQQAEKVYEAWKEEHPFTEVVCEILPAPAK